MLIISIYSLVKDVKRLLSIFGDVEKVIRNIALMLVGYGISKTLIGIAVAFEKLYTWLIPLLGAVSTFVQTATMATLVASFKSLGLAVMTSALPMLLIGAALAMIGLMIEDVYKYFSTGGKAETVVGFWHDNTAFGYVFIEMLKVAGKFIAGLVVLFTKFDGGLIREVLDEILTLLGRLFGLKDFISIKIILIQLGTGYLFAS